MAAFQGDGFSAAIARNTDPVESRKRRLNVATAVIALLLVITIIGGTVIGIGVIERFQDVQVRRHIYHSETEAKGVLLSRIRGFLGYDGLIHNFSLYVAEPTDVTATVLKRNLQEIRAQVANYELIGITAEEGEALGHIMAIVTMYEKRLNTLKRKVAAGERLSLRELPSGHDGQSALVAMAALESIWLASQSSELAAVTHTAKTGQQLTRAALFFVPLLLAVLVILIWFMKHLLNEIDARQKAEEDARELKGRAEKANISKSKFLANVSHELRTPLNAIIGFSDSLKEGIFGDLANDQQRQYVADINRAGNDLLAHINDILDLSAIEAGKLSLDEEKVMLHDVLEHSTRTVGMATSRGSNLVIHLDDPELAIVADRRRFQQILINLMSNAVKFSESEQEVHVMVSMDEENAIRITVTDHGIGMTADEAAMALEPFEQVGGANVRKSQGTGLGLPLTKSLVELHGGKLAIESEPGDGTSVVVTLPPSRTA